jgi:hypothetical protein
VGDTARHSATRGSGPLDARRLRWHTYGVLALELLLQHDLREYCQEIGSAVIEPGDQIRRAVENAAPGLAELLFKRRGASEPNPERAFAGNFLRQAWEVIEDCLDPSVDDEALDGIHDRFEDAWSNLEDLGTDGDRCVWFGDDQVRWREARRLP